MKTETKKILTREEAFKQHEEALTHISWCYNSAIEHAQATLKKHLQDIRANANSYSIERLSK